MATGIQAVAAAGTAEALVSSSTTCRRVIIQAFSGNTGIVVIGDSNVVATAGAERGFTLQPSQAVELGVKELADIYVDAVNSSDGVQFIYFNN